MRAAPNYERDYGGWGGANDTDVGDARALNACLALQRQLREASAADQAAAAAGAGRQAEAKTKAARQARARAEKAGKEAARCVEAVRAALRQGSPAGAPPGGPAGGGPELDDLALTAAVGNDEDEGEYDMADSLFGDLELEEFQVSRPGSSSRRGLQPTHSRHGGNSQANCNV